jgi:hypothetical protein
LIDARCQRELSRGVCEDGRKADGASVVTALPGVVYRWTTARQWAGETGRNECEWAKGVKMEMMEFRPAGAVPDITWNQNKGPVSE